VAQAIVTMQTQWHRLHPGFATTENTYPRALRSPAAGCQPRRKPVPLDLSAAAAHAA